jgi:hypothetical protein
MLEGAASGSLSFRFVGVFGHSRFRDGGCTRVLYLSPSLIVMLLLYNLTPSIHRQSSVRIISIVTSLVCAMVRGERRTVGAASLGVLFTRPAALTLHGLYLAPILSVICPVCVVYMDGSFTCAIGGGWIE